MFKKAAPYGALRRLALPAQKNPLRRKLEAIDQPLLGLNPKERHTLLPRPAVRRTLRAGEKT